MPYTQPVSVGELWRLIQEMDRRITDRFTAAEEAVKAALAAQEKQTAAAFLGSEKAIVKAEEAQKEYNVRSNEFRGQLEDQAQTLMPRIETQSMFKSYEEKLQEVNRRFEELRADIASVRDKQSATGGEKEAIDRNTLSTTTNRNLIWLLATTVLLSLIATGVALFAALHR